MELEKELETNINDIMGIKINFILRNEIYIYVMALMWMTHLCLIKKMDDSCKTNFKFKISTIKRTKIPSHNQLMTQMGADEVNNSPLFYQF